METEKIIIELFSRIKNLEEDVAKLKEMIAVLNAFPTDRVSKSIPDDIERMSTGAKKTKSYTKTTDEMIETCYEHGKKAYDNPDADIKEFANEVSQKTGMNKSSAVIYIYVAKSLLKGEIFKRVVSSAALRKYLDNILLEYGKNGLRKALTATELHIEYLKKYNIPVKSFVAIYNEYK